MTQRAPDGRIWVASDTCILVNFLVIGRFDLFCRHKDYRMVITEHVQAELTEPGQQAVCQAAITAGDIDAIEITDLAELVLFAGLSARLGRGEAATIAVAQNRGWAVATDEGGRTRREIDTHLGPGRLLTTPGLILRAILNGTLTVAEADAIKADLAKHRFAMRFASFAELLP
jgi:predicted nucleic acid-binding protein